MAARQQSYLSTALFALIPVNSPGLKTFAVDASWRVYLDFETAAVWGDQNAAGVLLHEVHHVLRRHNARALSAGVRPDEHELWNIACDAAINDDLRPQHQLHPDRRAADTPTQPHRCPRDRRAVMRTLQRGLDIGAALGIDDHLEECPSARGDWRECQWCDWALQEHDVRLAATLTDDVSELRHAGDTAAGQTSGGLGGLIVASARLRDQHQELDPERIRLASLRRATHELGNLLRDSLTELERHCLGHTTDDSPIVRESHQAALEVAAAALLDCHWDPFVGDLNPEVTTAVADARRRTIPDVVQRASVRVTHGLVCQPPELLSQPEWAALKPMMVPRRRQETPNVSLESFVTEGVATATRISPLLRLLSGLELPPVRLQWRRSSTVSSRATALQWGLRPPNWLAALAASGLMSCWRPIGASDGADITTTVAWYVAVAIAGLFTVGVLPAHGARVSAVTADGQLESLLGEILADAVVV